MPSPSSTAPISRSSITSEAPSHKVHPHPYTCPLVQFCPQGDRGWEFGNRECPSPMHVESLQLLRLERLRLNDSSAYVSVMSLTVWFQLVLSLHMRK